MVNGRPRKTQEELDREMEDYWGGAAGGDANGGQVEQEAVGFGGNVPDVQVDEDVDMIE